MGSCEETHRVQEGAAVSRTVVDILERAAAAELHTDPEPVLPQVGAEVGHDVRVAAVLHHQNLLLDDAKVVSCNTYG